MTHASPHRIVLAYSGGLETTVAIPWLAEHYQSEVVAVTLDLGQGAELTEIRERALAAGAVRAHVIDVREELVRDFILPALQAGVLSADRCALATALGHSIIAKRLVDVARMEEASTIAHGAKDLPTRLDISVRALDPSLMVIAPARTWEMSQADEVEYLRARNIPVPTSTANSHSTDANVWGRSITTAPSVDPGVEPPDQFYVLTRSSKDTPDEPAYLEIEFEAGVPVRANGIEMPRLELIESLEIIAGAHGVGRIERVESSVAGGPRGIHEAPAAIVLHTAHENLEKLVTVPDLEPLKRHLASAYVDLVYSGLWFSNTREAIDAFVHSTQRRVTGSVRVKLFKGTCRVVGLESPFALPDDGREAGGAGDRFTPAAVEGLIS